MKMASLLKPHWMSARCHTSLLRLETLSSVHFFSFLPFSPPFFLARLVVAHLCLCLIVHLLTVGIKFVITREGDTSVPCAVIDCGRISLRTSLKVIKGDYVSLDKH